MLQIGALLQAGNSVEDARLLHDLGALDPIVVMCAPSAGRVPDFDVASIDVRPGAHVEAGDRLVTLLDPRVMFLRADPVGSEQAELLAALAASETCSARPLVEHAAPVLSNITLDFVAGSTGSSGGSASAAFARVANTPLTVREQDSAHFRSWRLRHGQRYVLSLPVRTLTDVFVLPAGAVTNDGPHRVVFLVDGNSFQSVQVEVLYEDERVSVLPYGSDSHIFPGDVLVLQGAYALGLALRTDAGAAVDTHGHTH